jgi:hypothetical protein
MFCTWSECCAVINDAWIHQWYDAWYISTWTRIRRHPHDAARCSANPKLSVLADEDALIPSPTAAQPDAVNASPPSPAYDNTAPISDAMQQWCDTATRHHHHHHQLCMPRISAHYTKVAICHFLRSLNHHHHHQTTTDHHLALASSMDHPLYPLPMMPISNNLLYLLLLMPIDTIIMVLPLLVLSINIHANLPLLALISNMRNIDATTKVMPSWWPRWNTTSSYDPITTIWTTSTSLRVPTTTAVMLRYYAESLRHTIITTVSIDHQPLWLMRQPQ